jgi:hypothetical protein
MDGSIAPLVVLLVGLLILGLAAVAGGVDSREFDPDLLPSAWPAGGE